MASGIKVIAPATIANLNCGYDVLGLAIETTADEVIVRKSPNPGISITAITGARNLPMNPEKNTAGVAVMKYLEYLGARSQGFTLEIHKKIGPGSGLGSSAASACAAVVAVNELLRRPLSKKELLPFAVLGEYAADGSIHGDNVAACLLGGIVLVRDIRLLDVHRIYSPVGLYITVVIPAVELLTSKARGVLQKDVPLRLAVRQAANLGAFVLGLQKSDFDLISRALTDHIIEPQRAGLISGFDRVKAAALEAGALGAGISGAGPTLFALSSSDTVAAVAAESMEREFSALDIESRAYVSLVNQAGTTVC